MILAHYETRELAKLRDLADFSVVVDTDYAPVWHHALLATLRRMRDLRGIRRAYPAAFQALASVGPERTALARWESLEFALEGLQSLRYKHYYDVLQGIAPDADQIFLSDLRDVLFQVDPFAPTVAELEVFLEAFSVQVTEEPFNRRWLRALYGETVVSDLRGSSASCSGTVIGRRDGILHYLKEMQCAITWRRRLLGNHDQGVHNYLLRTGRLGSPLVVENGHGRVLTMGVMAQVIRGPDGTILNTDGTVPAVLHQYDRDPPRAEELRARFAS